MGEDCATIAPPAPVLTAHRSIAMSQQCETTTSCGCQRSKETPVSDKLPLWPPFAESTLRRPSCGLRVPAAVPNTTVFIAGQDRVLVKTGAGVTACATHVSSTGSVTIVGRRLCLWGHRLCPTGSRKAGDQRLPHRLGARGQCVQRHIGTSSRSRQEFASPL